MEEVDREVEDFLSSTEVDVQAAESLRTSEPGVQRLVLGRGGLSSARNPSSVLLARIRDAVAAVARGFGSSASNGRGSNRGDDALGMDDSSVGWVKMRGLPFSATTDDVLNFFAGLEPTADKVVLGVSKDGRPSGEAFVAFASGEVAQQAIEERDKQEIGGRYIELFSCTGLEVQRGDAGSGYGAVRRDGRSERGSFSRARESSGPYGSQGAPSQASASARDLEAFLAGGPVDERAGEAFRGCDFQVQQAVMERGSLQGARNPSALLLSRIQDAEKTGRTDRRGGHPAAGGPAHFDPRGGSGGGWGGPSVEDVEDFLRQNSVDDRAADAFRSAAPQAQGAVMERGDLRSAKNPSAALLARLRDAQSGGGGGHGGGGGGGHMGRRLEDFLHASGVDEMAAAALKACHPEVQMAVIEKQSVGAARNPSSALLARIRDEKQAAAAAGHPGGAPSAHGAHGSWEAPHAGQFHQQRSLGEHIEDFLVASGVDGHAADALRESPAGQQEAVLAIGDLKSARNPSAVLLARLRDTTPRSSAGPPGHQGGHHDPHHAPHHHAQQHHAPPFAVPHVGYPPLGRDLHGDLEHFLAEQQIDEMAAEALRDCPPEVLVVVLERGVAGARNPSSALLARIREVRAEVGHRSGFGQGPADPHGGRAWPEDDLFRRVEEFLSGGLADERSQDVLRGCAPHVQEEVVARGGLGGTRNPSAVLLSRIRDAEGGDPARKGAGKGPPPPQQVAYEAPPPFSGVSQRPRRGPSPREVEDFLDYYRIDRESAESFMACHPEVQQEIMDHGLEGARNPSSALLARIRDLGDRQPRSAPSRNVYGAAPHHQAPRAAHGYGEHEDYGVQDYGGGEEAAYGAAHGGHAPGRHPAEVVEEFLRQNPVDEKATEALVTCPEHVQLTVVDRGSLTNTRNPSASLLARIRDAQAGARREEPRSDRGDPRGRPAETVEGFLMEHPVDARAAEDLRNCSFEVQQLVLKQGIKGARNPGSALLARIRDARTQVEGERSSQSHGQAESQQWDEWAAAEARGKGGGGGYDHRQGHGQGHGQGHSSGPSTSSRDRDNRDRDRDRDRDRENRPATHGGERGGGSGEKGGSNRPAPTVESFLAANPELDEHAVEALRSAQPYVAEAAMRRGGLGSARKPSSVLLSRLREAEAALPGGGGGGGGGGGASSKGGGGGGAPKGGGFPQKSVFGGAVIGGAVNPDFQVEDFLSRNGGIDAEAAEALRVCVPEVQQLVTGEDISGARNPSSALLARIGKAKASLFGARRGTGAPSGGGRSAPY